MDVIVWNMQQKDSNWRLLADGGELAADVHIVCEAPRPPRGQPAIGAWRTVGLEDDLPLDRVRTDRPWSTGILARTDIRQIVDARSARGYKKPALLPFRPSRPGSWTAGVVRMKGRAITVISLYGLLDESSDASVHRSLSELSPIFDHPRYGKHVILGGDLNIVTNPRPDDPIAARYAAVLARFRSYGLKSCVERASPSLEPFEDCPCGNRPCDEHRRTFRRYGAAAYEEDYLFASRRMFDKLGSFEVLPFKPSSDHAPIRATFSI